MEKLEKEHGWREEEFDFILQFMRTLLLKRATPFCRSHAGCGHGLLTSLRWSIADLHDTIPRKITTKLDTLHSRNSLSP